jgi:hypothetical protein
MRSRLPPGLSALGERLNDVGFERTRRALAGLVLSLFVSLYLLIALNRPEGLTAAMLALAGCYAVAFLGVVAEWFWGRWFASGLGWSGIMVAIASLAMLGWTPFIAIYGGLHLLVVVALLGKKMAARYDLQEAWRARYNMDEFGVDRLRKTVTRAAASLPSLILWALGPKEGEGMVLALGGLCALALAGTGLRGVVRMRSWGVLALGGALAAVLAFGHVTAFTAGLHATGAPGAESLFELAGPTLAFACLAAAVLPFVGPVRRFLRRTT